MTRCCAAGSSTSSTSAAERYTGRTWAVRDRHRRQRHRRRVHDRRGRMVVIERDDFQGPASVIKRLYEVDLRRTDADGFVAQGARRRPAAHRQPGPASGRPARPSAYGVGDPFAFAAAVGRGRASLLDDGRLLVGLDNNYAGGNGRVAGHARRHRADRASTSSTSAAADARRPARHRPPRGQRLPPRAHAGRLRDWPSLQCADYIEPDVVVDQGRRAGRPSRERDRRHHRRRRPPRVRRSPDDEGDRRRRRHRLVHRGLHARRAEDAAGRRAASRRCGRQNTAFNGLYQVPTFDEVLDLARHSRTCDGDPVGVYPETKHPTYFDGIGLSLEEPLVDTLDAERVRRRRGRR